MIKSTGWMMMVICFCLAGCGTVPMPRNVTTTPYESGRIIDVIDFSYRPVEQKTFPELRLCIAETIHNDAVTLLDGSNSFVGPATLHYYSINQNQVVPGGIVFKYLDENQATLIAQGAIDAGLVWGITRDFVNFDLKAAIASESVVLKFMSIKRAQQNTGGIANDGFQPAGTWSGARPLQNIEALETVAGRIKQCMV